MPMEAFRPGRAPMEMPEGRFHEHAQEILEGYYIFEAFKHQKG